MPVPTIVPTSETLLALATRCEAASWPDRELDADISRIIHPEIAAEEWPTYDGDFPPPFTASLDGAAFLVLEACHWMVDSGDYRSGGPRGWVKPQGNRRAGHNGRAATPALALCAAALRARAALA